MTNAQPTPGPWMPSSSKVQITFATSGAVRRVYEIHKDYRHRQIQPGDLAGFAFAFSKEDANLIGISPDLLKFAAQIARMTQDGEEVNGEEFCMENDDAVSTLNALIDEARALTAKAANV